MGKVQSLAAELKRKGALNWIPDKTFLKLEYKAKTGGALNLDSPQTFNDKINWLKLNDRNPLYTTLVDKFAVKKYIEGKIGSNYVVRLLGVWDSFDEIDFSKLPEAFVLKCTHDSGGLAICRDKAAFDVEQARESINKCLKRNYYWMTREWPYRNVPRKIIAEEYLENDELEGLHDYKVWCFNGEPLYVQYITGRLAETYELFYDQKWNKQTFTYHNPLYFGNVKKPDCLEELLDVCRKLADGIPFVRVDFYILSDGTLKFGEMTFYPMGGMQCWHPQDMDYKLGEKITLK